jgi:hypothetical protein
VAQSDVIQGELDAFYKTQQNPLSLYNEAQSKLGIPEIRTRVSGLRTSLTNTENLLNQVEGSVTGRTQGSLVTEAQRQRLVNLERQPLTTQYGQMSGQLTNESANLSDLLGQAGNTTNLTLQGYATTKQDITQRLSTAKEKESEARRQAEWAAQQAASDRAFAEGQRQFNVSQANARAAAAASTAKPSLEQALAQIGGSYVSGKGYQRFVNNQELYQKTKGGAGYATREQIANTVAVATGLPYAKALQAVYKRFPG